jgi:2-polyprenyl-3-methyl-5-hydroxy-6-metoxy-1,4-benzoquinol methylase
VIQLSNLAESKAWTNERGGQNYMPNPVRPDWSAPAVARYFGWVGTNPHKQDGYFSLQVGPAIARFLELAGVLKGRVVDYGCGPGYLADRLVHKNIQLHAADFSAEAVDIVNLRLAGQPNWHGARLIRSLPCAQLEDSHFDLAMCIEAIEHLSDEYLESTFTELKRIVKPGGYAFLTTPNAEDLEKGMSYCPFCESEFHAAQHVRKFTEQSLRQTLEERGWEVTFCQGIHLWRFMQRPWPGRWDFNLRYAVGSWNRFFAAAKDRILPRPFPSGKLFQILCSPGPHLVALARKKN